MSKLTFSFFRNYEKYTGGHQKFYDYLMHTKAITDIQCHLFVQKDCKVMPGLFRGIDGIEYQNEYDPTACNIVFLAGMDWQYYLPHRKPNDVIVNLIQHVRHGDKSHPLFSYLKYNALRICVSNAVKTAIAPYANGHCEAIPMGHVIPQLKYEKCYDLYILAKKNPHFGRTVARWAEERGFTCKLHDCLVSKEDVLTSFAKSKVTLALPNPTEGFFLPGIEAMALSDRVVVPDCIANREYCTENTNALLCEYNIDAVKKAITRSLKMLQTDTHRLQKRRGENTARSYTLIREREIYHKLIRELVVPLCAN